jgi:hypothetical protein
LILAVVLALANQLSGINAILFYANQLFNKISKGNAVNASKYVVGLGVFQVIVTFASGFLINQFGRKRLMIIGESIVTASLLLGFFFNEFV